MRNSTRSLSNARTLGVTAAVVAALSGAAFGTVGADQPSAAAPTTTAAAPTTSAATPTTAGAPTTTAATPTTAAGGPATTAAGATTTAAGATTTAAGATTTAAGATTTAAGAATLLPASTPLDQLQQAVVGVHGPTTDLMAELAPFVNAVPPGIPTPQGADVVDFRIYYYPDVDEQASSYYSSGIRFTSAVPAQELVAFYQSAMPAAGYVQTGDSVENDDDRQIRRLEYDVPAPTSDQDEVQIIIVDETASTRVDFVDLEAYYGLDPAVVQIFAAWPGNIPLIAGVPVGDVTMSTFGFGGDITLNLSNSYDVPIAPADAFAQFEAGLAGTGYTIDPDSDPAEGYFDILGGELGEATIFLNEGFPEGTTSLMIDSSFDIVG